MTRRNQILRWGEQYLKKRKTTSAAMFDGFVTGAEWADANPDPELIKVYIDLIIALDQYREFMQQQYSIMFGFAHIHGWMDNTVVIDEGKELRDNIDNARAVLEKYKK